MSAPGTLLLVAGSRSLGRDAKAFRWSRDHLKGLLLAYPGAVVLTGGAEGPDVWAEDLALLFGHRVVVYRPDGSRRESFTHDADKLSRWGTPPASGQGAPLIRNAAMVDRARRAHGLGWRVVVLGLVDEGSKSRGTDHCLGLAKGAGLEVFRFAWGTAVAKVEETKGEAA